MWLSSGKTAEVSSLRRNPNRPLKRLHSTSIRIYSQDKNLARLTHNLAVRTIIFAYCQNSRGSFAASKKLLFAKQLF
jgi:hypothetical protein